MERKVVLITGASKGIGQATSQFLLQKGLTVYGTSRHVSNGDSQNNIQMLHLDLTDKSSIHAAVNFVLEKEGRIDVLINNAGTGISGALEDMTMEDYQKYFNAHVFGVMECCNAVIPTMRKQKSGKIINISSIGGDFGLPFRGAYSASKSALNRMSETLRMELAPWNIFVSLIKPGDISSSINDSRIIPAKSLSDESVFNGAFKKQYEHISQEVSNGQDPTTIGKVAYKIIQSANPKMNYVTGTFTQRISIFVSRVLPKRVFQKLLSNRYPVK